eukprot:SM000022S07262  [mRNA]  locus=s22:862725:864480:- [translate_table: standard]
MDDCGRGDTSARSALGFRIGGLFGVLTASAVGVLLPFLLSFFGGVSFRNPFFFIGRAFAAGVVLAVGYVHILPDAAADLSNPCLHFSTSFPWAYAFALAASLCTFCLEFWLRMVSAPSPHLALLCKLYLTLVACSRCTDATHRFTPCGLSRGDDLEGAKANPKQVDLEKERRLEWNVVALTLEAGIIFHSVFVGLTLGTNTDIGYVRGLMFALLFHQGFEGLALGAAFCKAGYNKRKYAIMGLLFALSTPVGIAIGISVSINYNENDPSVLGTQGSFNAVAGGILIYNGLADLIIPTFSDEDRPASNAVVSLGFVAMFAGAACMSLIAKWA